MKHESMTVGLNSLLFNEYNRIIKGADSMFRKKKPDKPKYYKTIKWRWTGLILYPLGYSMRAVTEYDPNDTYELFCHDVYGCIPTSLEDGLLPYISPQP